MGHGKPNPEPYVIGAKRISNELDGYIVLEDSVNGSLVGKAAGAIIVVVPSTESDSQRLLNSDFIVKSLIKSLKVLKGMDL